MAPEIPDIPSTNTVPPTPVLPPGAESALPPTIPDYDLPPQEARKWNWGAGLMALFWLPAMRLWWLFAFYLITFIVVLVLALLESTFAKLIRFGLLGFSWYLIRYGSTLAWKSRPWRSIEHFNQVQRIWLWWGLAMLLVQILIGIAGVFLAAEFARELPNQ